MNSENSVVFPPTLLMFGTSNVCQIIFVVSSTDLAVPSSPRLSNINDLFVFFYVFLLIFLLYYFCFFCCFLHKILTFSDHTRKRKLWKVSVWCGHIIDKCLWILIRLELLPSVLQIEPWNCGTNSIAILSSPLIDFGHL